MADEDKSPNKTIHITLTPEARRTVEGIRSDSGVPHTEAMTRILEWFASLDRKLRLAILTRDNDTRTELTRLWASQVAGLEGPVSPDALSSVTAEEAAKIAYAAIARLEQIERARKRQFSQKK